MFFWLESRTVCAFEPYRKFKYNGNFHIFRVGPLLVAKLQTCATAREGKQSGGKFLLSGKVPFQPRILDGDVPTFHLPLTVSVCLQLANQDVNSDPCRAVCTGLGTTKNSQTFKQNSMISFLFVVTPQRHVFSKVPNIFEVAPIVGPLGKQEFMKARKGGTQRLMDF